MAGWSKAGGTPDISLARMLRRAVIEVLRTRVTPVPATAPTFERRG